MRPYQRAAIAGFAIIALLLLLWEARRMAIITLPGEFDLQPGSAETVTLPTITPPTIPDYAPGPDTWGQTTGLMCACDVPAYSAPMVVRNIKVPLPPLPQYVYHTPSVEAVAGMALTYNASSTFTIDSSFIAWGNRPPARAYQGSDGRLFLLDQKSDSNLTVGVDEYKMVNGNIVYGPYVYKPAHYLSQSARSA